MCRCVFSISEWLMGICVSVWAKSLRDSAHCVHLQPVSVECEEMDARLWNNGPDANTRQRSTLNSFASRALQIKEASRIPTKTRVALVEWSVYIQWLGLFPLAKAAHIYRTPPGETRRNTYTRYNNEGFRGTIQLVFGGGKVKDYARCIFCLQPPSVFAEPHREAKHRTPIQYSHAHKKNPLGTESSTFHRLATSQRARTCTAQPATLF